MIDDILSELNTNCQNVSENLEKEFSRLRTGRASPSLLDNVRVDYYGMPTPLKQVATVSVGDSRLLTVSPWDKGKLSDIEKAIQASGLGLTPSNDGKIIRIPIPALTGERRKELVRQVKKLGEEYKVTIRGYRRDSNELLKSAEENKDITEDEYHRGLKRIQQETDDRIKDIDRIINEKEQEIMEF